MADKPRKVLVSTAVHVGNPVRPGVPFGDDGWAVFLDATQRLLRHSHIRSVTVTYTDEWAKSPGDAKSHTYFLAEWPVES